MKVYEVLDFKEGAYKIIVATSYVSPLSQIPIISMTLAKENYEGKVLFDLLLSNGFSSNRFIEGHFNGVMIEMNSLRVIQQVNNDALQYIYNYFYNNPKLIHRSSLPETQKHLLMNNLIKSENKNTISL